MEEEKVHNVSVLTYLRDYRPLGDLRPFPAEAARTPLQQERQETQKPLDTPSDSHAGKMQLGCICGKNSTFNSGAPGRGS